MRRKRNYAYVNKRSDSVRLFLTLANLIKRYKIWVMAGAGLCIAVTVILVLPKNEGPSTRLALPAETANFAAAASNAEISDKGGLTGDGPSPTIQPGLQDYYNQNGDLVGWIKIPNTVIDYPVVQTADNEQYMTTDFAGKPSEHGAIFLDCRCDSGNLSGGTNLVVYGHHMKDGSMFADLVKYKDEDFFKQNQVIEFDTLNERLKWEIFSVYVAPTTLNYIDTTFVTRQGWEKFLRKCKEQSRFENNVVPGAEDAVLTLSTCSYEFNDARFVVQARLIKDE